METMELSSTHHQYTGLDHSTGYVIVMAAVNSAGMGPWVNRSVYTLVPPNPTTEPTNATSDTPAPTEDRTILTALGAAIGVIGGLLVALLLCAVCCIVTYVIIKIITSRNGRKKLAEDEDVDNMIYIQLEEQERCIDEPYVVMSSSSIIVGEIPYFLEFPTDTKASEGETVYFKVHIAGTPIPTWYWYHQGEPLTAQGNIQIFSDGTLIIDNIQQENEGVYTFIARNTAGDLKQDVQLEITTEDEEKLQDLQSQHARSLIIEHKPVPLDTLEKYVEMQHSNDNEPFNFLYTSLSPGGDGKTAKANENRERNRYKNIVPYDHNAVELDPIPVWDVFQHSYINASYIDGFDTKKKFIATQGPLPHTITDFWRMIWKEKSPIIVMLTNKIEGSRVKCEEYWPPSMSTEQDYGAFIVKLIAEEVFANFVIRRCLIHLSDGTQSFHEVEQFHYTAWPDHGVPDHGSPLLLFRQRVMQSYAKHGGPIVVHCSAGAGRTGTFIALDIGLEQVNSELQVDFVAIVNKLREQRMKMIQTSAQFMFLYDALLEYMLCDNTLISVAKLSEVMASLHKIGLNKKTGYEVQFQLIQKITPKSSGYKCDIGKVNREKNRPNALLPVDMRRVVLRGHSTDYINATYMDGYQLKKEFIITQSPMQSTVADFWKMIVQHRSLTIIMLCGLEENSKDICHQYWPSDVDTNIIFDNFSIKLMNELNESESIIRRTLGVKDSKSGVCQTVIQYQVMNWLPDGQCSNHCTIGNLYTLVSDNQRRGDTSYKPIIVHCSDTITRSAMYCAIHNAIEQAKLEQGVDIFQVVKAVRMQRPASINSLVHYKTIYEVVSFYLSSFTMYSQFRRDDTL
jgi:protein tyrosine phosphatase